MKPVYEWKYSLNKWCPAALVWLIYVLIYPVRVLVMLLLPRDSRYEWHPLHKLNRFWEF